MTRPDAILVGRAGSISACSPGGRRRPASSAGVGLMVDGPGLELSAAPAPAWAAEGPLAGRDPRVRRTGSPGSWPRGVARPRRCTSASTSAPRARGPGHRDPARPGGGPHPGRRRRTARPARRRPSADLAGRGLRSGIGLHGFGRGGLIVDGGRRGPEGVPALLARLEFPERLGRPGRDPRRRPRPARPRRGPGVRRAARPSPEAADRPPLPARPARPAARRRRGRPTPLRRRPRPNSSTSSAGPSPPRRAGPTPGPSSQAIVDHLRAEGLHGVGQSSWGPTLYGFRERDPGGREPIEARLRARFGDAAGAALWTVAAGPSLLSRGP